MSSIFVSFTVCFGQCPSSSERHKYNIQISSHIHMSSAGWHRKGGEGRGQGVVVAGFWMVGVKNFFPYPNELLIWAYPENLVKIRLIEAMLKQEPSQRWMTFLEFLLELIMIVDVPDWGWCP